MHSSLTSLGVLASMILFVKASQEAVMFSKLAAALPAGNDFANAHPASSGA